MYVFLMSRCKLIEIDNAHLNERYVLFHFVLKFTFCRISSLNQYLANKYDVLPDSQILLIDGGSELKALNEFKEHGAGEVGFTFLCG